MGVANFIRRNFVTVLFPTLTTTFIYLDWSYTQKWKALQQKKE